MKVGILELLSNLAPLNWYEHIYDRWFRKQFISLMPQAIAVWCRQLGHRVHYATFYGQGDPKTLLPGDLDIVFISSHTQASPLAYALAKLYRRENTLTVMGGPHAKAFPGDCLRFFDLAVQECDKNLIDAILRFSFNRHTLVTSAGLLQDIPSVEERIPEIVRASFNRGRPSAYSNVPMLTSLGCPYSCDFCVDGERPYVLLPLDRLAEDLGYLSRRLPKVTIAYHDPNFGVKFDKVLETIEAIPERARNRYAMGCSLSILRGSRLPRLKNTNCIYLGAGVESWNHYSHKAGIGSSEGSEKLERVVAHFQELSHYVPNLGACFLFGTDGDRGGEPVELTREFIHRVPFVWPGISIPVPYGGTPFHQVCLREDRILKVMPFGFYSTPYLVFQPKNYGPMDYYERLIRLIAYATSSSVLVRRISKAQSASMKGLRILRTVALSGQLSEMRQIWDRLKSDEKFRAFHEGRVSILPDFYKGRFRKRLGRYAELISEGEMVPELESMPLHINSTGTRFDRG